MQNRRRALVVWMERARGQDVAKDTRVTFASVLQVEASLLNTVCTPVLAVRCGQPC